MRVVADARAGVGVNVQRLSVLAVVDGPTTQIVDANGDCVAIVETERLRYVNEAQATEECKTRLFVDRLHSQIKDRRPDGAWDRKIDTWLTTLRKRRPASLGIGKKRKHRETWGDAVESMFHIAFNRKWYRKKITADPWLAWCDTVAANHRRKQRERDGKPK